MLKSQKYKAYLVIVLRSGQQHRVYAVAKPTAEEALMATKAAHAEAKDYLVGGFARNMARKLKLKHDEMRPV